MGGRVFGSGCRALLSGCRTIGIRTRSRVWGTSSFAVASLACAWSNRCLAAEGRPPGGADHSLLDAALGRITATNSRTLFSVRVEEHLISGRQCCELSSWRWPLVPGFGDAVICAPIVKTWTSTELEGRLGLLGRGSLA